MADDALLMPREQFEKQLDIELRDKRIRQEDRGEYAVMRREQFENARRRRFEAQKQAQQGMEARATAMDPTYGAAAGKLVSAGVAAGTGLADTATAGHGPQILGAVSPALGGAAEESIDYNREENPVAYTAGALGGFMGSKKLPGDIGRAESFVGAASRMGGEGLAIGTGASRLARNSLESSLFKRFTSSLIANSVADVGATTTASLIMHRDRERTLAAEMADLNESLNPKASGEAKLGAAINIGQALVESTFASRVSKHIVEPARQYERLTGNKPHWSILTDGSRAESQSWLEAMSKSPFTRGATQKYIAGFHEDMNMIFDGIAREHGVRVRGGQTAKTAGFARYKDDEAAGAATKTLIGHDKVPGSVTAARRKSEADYLNANATTDKMNPVDQDALRQTLMRARADIRRASATIEGSIEDAPNAIHYMERLLDMTSRPQIGMKNGLPVYGKKPELTLENLENIRVGLSRLAYGGGKTIGIDGKDVKGSDEAAMTKLYAIVDEAIYNASPKYHAILKEAEQLRAMERALGKRTTLDSINGDEVRRFWGDKKNVMQRYEALEKHASPDEVSAVKGWLLGDFLEEVARGSDTGVITKHQLKRVMGSKGRYNRSLMERVFGKRFIRQMEMQAEIGEAFGRGIGKAEGSDTARRVAYQTGTAVAAGSMIHYTKSILSNDYGDAAGAIGAAGIAALIQRALVSSISGKIHSKMQSVALAGGARQTGRLQAAVGQMGRQQTELTEKNLKQYDTLARDQYGSEISSQ